MTVTIKLDPSNRIVLSRDLRRAAGIPPGQKLKVSAMPGRIVLEIEPNPGKIVKRGKLKLWTGQVPSLPIERRLSKCGSLEIIPIDQASLHDAWEVSCLSRRGLKTTATFNLSLRDMAGYSAYVYGQLWGANGLEAGFISVYERAVVLKIILGGLAVLSFLLLLWQWLVGLRFPLHRRIADQEFAPGVTLLKSLKGVDDSTEKCLRSWFVQNYSAPVQILFGAASAEDPVCNVARKLLKEFPNVEAELKICGPLTGTNAKVSKLIELERLAKHEVLIISDADVRVPPDFLSNVVAPLRDEKVGLVNCFYRLANPSTTAMQCEAIAINADFWSQVLQSQSLKPLDFALGAVVATKRARLKEIGGFEALANCLADDYQLGNRIARGGHKIALCPAVVDCWSSPMDWAAVWKHQLRWARTIRVCQPVPYFFSILSNPTLWPLLWWAVNPTFKVFVVSCGFGIFRVLTALNLQARLMGARPRFAQVWLVPLKDLLQTGIWFCAFAGNRVEWRGRQMRLRKDGTIETVESAPAMK